MSLNVLTSFTGSITSSAGYPTGAAVVHPRLGRGEVVDHHGVLPVVVFENTGGREVVVTRDLRVTGLPATAGRTPVWGSSPRLWAPGEKAAHAAANKAACAAANSTMAKGYGAGTKKK